MALETLERLTEADIEALERAIASRPTRAYEAVVDAETIRVRATMRTFLEEVAPDIKQVAFQDLVAATSDLAIEVIEPAVVNASAAAAETWSLPSSAASTASSLAPQAAAETIVHEQIARNVRWAIAPLVDESLDPTTALRKAITQLQDTTGRRVREAPREAGLVVAQREGHKLRAVSIPRGVTCPWCLTMATRSDLIKERTRRDATGRTNVWHPHCDCSVELTAKGAEPTGINLLAADLYSDREKWNELTKWISDKSLIEKDHDWKSD